MNNWLAKVVPDFYQRGKGYTRLFFFYLNGNANIFFPHYAVSAWQYDVKVARLARYSGGT